MTSMVETALVQPVNPVGQTVGDPRRAMLALARVEAVRAVRHPVTIAAALLFIGPWLYGWLSGDANRYPVLHDEDRGTTQFLVALLLGGAALVVGNLAVRRPQRHGTKDLYDVLVLPTPWRIGAHLLAVLPVGLLAAALVGVRITVLALAPDAVGRPNPYELATGPAAVLLLGAVGVLLARLGDTMITALLAVLAYGVLTFWLGLLNMEGDLWPRWLLPVALEQDWSPMPADLLARPAAAHLGYLAGLVVLVVVAAAAHAGARGRRLVAAGVAGLLIATAAGAAQVRPVSDAVVADRIAATERPAERQTCERIDQVTYCAFPDFAPWVDSWDAVVRGVLRQVPAAEARRPFAVRQRVWAHGHPEGGSWASDSAERGARAEEWRAADRAAGTPNAITVGTTWGDGWSELGLAGLVAYEVMTRKGAGADGVVCGARGVLLGWLVGQATPATATGLRMVDASSTGGVQFSEPSYRSGVSVSDREMTVALHLLRRPADEVAAVVQRSWAELTAADTTTERLGEIFGVAVPSQLPEAERSVCSA